MIRRSLTDRIRAATGKSVIEVRRQASRGYTNNSHWVARVGDGRSVFVKQAVDEQSAAWLRQEKDVYQALNVEWAPSVHGWHDDGDCPVLVLDDLSRCDIAPPWTTDRVEAVRRTLAQVAAYPVPKCAPDARTTSYAEGGWPEVADDPRPFLSLGLCSPAWLDRALPVLAQAASFELLAGGSLQHLDVRSDNLFFRGSTAVLVDWNLAAVGNPDFDLAFWLPSLRMEGGPEPEQVQDVPPGVVALVTGIFASRAGLPVIPVAPKVRDVQRRQLAVALPWAARSLDLPRPDGHESP
jgi:hypothetical protein